MCVLAIDWLLVCRQTEMSEDETDSSAYMKLVASLKVSAKYNNMLKSRRLEQEGADEVEATDDDEDEEQDGESDGEGEEGMYEDEEEGDEGDEGEDDGEGGREYHDPDHIEEAGPSAAEENEVGDDVDEGVEDPEDPFVQHFQRPLDDDQMASKRRFVIVQASQQKTNEDKKTNSKKSADKEDEEERSLHPGLKSFEHVYVDFDASSSSPSSSSPSSSSSVPKKKTLSVTPTHPYGPMLGGLTLMETLEKTLHSTMQAYHVKLRLARVWRSLSEGHAGNLQEVEYSSATDEEEEEVEVALGKRKRGKHGKKPKVATVVVDKINRKNKGKFNDKRDVMRDDTFTKADVTKDNSLLKMPYTEFFPNAFQQVMFSFMNTYSDVMYSNRKRSNASLLVDTYVLHCLNHVFKTRDRVVKNNLKIAAKEAAEQELNNDVVIKGKNGKKFKTHNKSKSSNNKGVEKTVTWTAEEEESFRDQGYTRTKVLILVPFRHTAHQVVHTMIKTMNPQQVFHKKRFDKEFGEEEESEMDPTKPADFKATFAGNTDDCFRVGVSFTRKSVKLYSDFYNSDILVASPLGLRMIVGSEGDKKKEYDFLSSVEVVVLDQAHVFSMQNWSHIETVFDCMNKIPYKTRDCDFSRIKECFLNGNSARYRQTLLFSEYTTVDHNKLFNSLENIAGRIKIKPSYQGTIAKVAQPLKQMFQRVDCTSIANMVNNALSSVVVVVVVVMAVLRLLLLLLLLGCGMCMKSDDLIYV